jgi:hypothetical protein
MDWYLKENPHRRLTWQHSLGSATVKARFGGKTYDLQTNTLQVGGHVSSGHGLGVLLVFFKIFQSFDNWIFSIGPPFP